MKQSKKMLKQLIKVMLIIHIALTLPFSINANTIQKEMLLATTNYH
jgi:hypothetical protein